jgi:hypothetical protein
MILAAAIMAQIASVAARSALPQNIYQPASQAGFPLAIASQDRDIA